MTALSKDMGMSAHLRAAVQEIQVQVTNGVTKRRAVRRPTESL
jgi:hypothetical protein